MTQTSATTFGHDALACESRGRRWFYLALALLLTAGFFNLTDAYWTPAHGGVDQNGYLVGGKMLAETGSMALEPRDAAGQLDPYQFVGRMWIGAELGTAAERYYPKYPIGLPLLYAGALRLGGDGRDADISALPAGNFREALGPWLVYRVSPVAMTLAVLGVFFLARPILGSLGSLLAAIVVGVSPVTLALSDNPNSHAATLCFVTWGMVALLAWWRRGPAQPWTSLWRPALAGMLLGYAVTIRYTEGLLLLPMLAIALFNLSPQKIRSWLAGVTLLAGWALPVVALLVHNRMAFHAWTGYDPTNESSGFAWAYFADNWRTMLAQLHDTGLAFVFPLALAGLLAMFVYRWRLALVLTAWVLPNLLIYTFYYWAPDRAGNNVGYLRFFLTAFPPLAIAGFWLLAHVTWTGRQTDSPVAQVDSEIKTSDDVRPALRWPSLVAGVMAMLVILMNLPRGLEMLDRELPGRLALDASAQQVLRSVPAGAVLLAQDTQLLHHLQFVGHYQLYNLDEFNPRQLARLRQIDPDEPQGLQPQRAQMIADRLSKMDARQLAIQQELAVNAALASGRRVFCIAPQRQAAQLMRTFPQRVFEVLPVDSWNNPLATASPTLRPPPTPRRQAPPPMHFNSRDTAWQVFEIKHAT